MAIKVEPYWNVKDDSPVEDRVSAEIKVEPYWNVKTNLLSSISSAFCIKVEPYWNVKLKSHFSRYRLIILK